MLAALHQSTPAAGPRAPVAAIGLARREALDAAGAAGQIHGLLEIFDRLARAMRGREFVITHGEPHPGNVMRAGPRRMLIDWDTVGLGPPERDLWLVAGETGQESRRYADLTGRAVDPAGLAWYRLRWALDDIAAHASRLRGEHRHTADTEHAWLALEETVAAAIRPESGFPNDC
jgi:spectinomycin phosphotransferase